MILMYTKVWEATWSTRLLMIPEEAVYFYSFPICSCCPHSLSPLSHSVPSHVHIIYMNPTLSSRPDCMLPFAQNLFRGTFSKKGISPRYEKIPCKHQREWGKSPFPTWKRNYIFRGKKVCFFKQLYKYVSIYSLCACMCECVYVCLKNTHTY